MVRSGRDAPTAKLMMIPEAWSKDSTLPDDHRAMYAFFASLMEPWDGPAALAMTDGRWMVAGVDRNALRPMRYTITGDNLLLVGSETGMVPFAEANVVEKGALGPGQIIAVDLEEKRLYHDREIKDRIAAAKDYASLIANFIKFETLPGGEDGEPPQAYQGADLRRRLVAAGMTLEDIELILSPMVEDAKEAVGSMGDDTPLGVVSPNPRIFSHFFRQNFQPGHQPADRLAAREPRDEPEDALFQLHQCPRREGGAERRHRRQVAGADQPRLAAAEAAFRRHGGGH